MICTVVRLVGVLVSLFCPVEEYDFHFSGRVKNNVDLLWLKDKRFEWITCFELLVF